jgi:phage gp37-like protein
MIRDIENRILVTLRTTSDADVLGYKYRTLETYPEDWDTWFKEKDGATNAPAAWIGFRGWRALKSEDSGPLKVRAAFMLIVMSENARSEEQWRRHGDPVETNIPGSYQLVLDAAAILHKNALGLPMTGLKIGDCLLVRQREALKQRKVSMLALELFAEITGIDPLTFDTDVADFARVHIDWDIPPFGGIDADPDTDIIQLPDPANADASDDIEVEN